MEPNEIQDLLEELNSLQQEAYAEDIPNMDVIHIIAKRLNDLGEGERHHFKAFAEQLKNLLFQSGISSPFLDLTRFGEASILQENAVVVDELEITVIVESLPTQPASVETSVLSSPIIGYKELFINIITSLQGELRTSKGYFFMQLQSDIHTSYKPLILHDKKCFYHSVKKKLEIDFPGCECYDIADFKSQIDTGKHQGDNYAVLLMLSTKVNDQEFVDLINADLKSLIEAFPDYAFIELKKMTDLKKSDFINHNNTDDFLAEIEYVTSTFLMNAELSNDEEKLIKQLFKHPKSSSILEYKVLKGGKSGSKVLEIKPKMKFNNEITKRFVAKFGPVDGKDKISKEMNAYSEFIENYKSLYQSAHYEKTASIEGMKYSYASQDGVQMSYSYASIIDDEKNRYHDGRKDLIDELFQSSPFDIWLVSKETSEFSVKELYSTYIVPEKFIAAVQKIKGLSDTDVKNDQLVTYFNEIFEYRITTVKKVCHGDLHSENFFKDDSGVIYLIDFGFTGDLHALVDHTALECSIKFKHIPFYIDIDLLSQIERELTLEDSFNLSFSVTSARKDIVDYFDIITKIRANSSAGLTANPSNRLEYLISLFIMTCRQVQYSDLNQLYALKSAEIIGERIKQLMTA